MKVWLLSLLFFLHSLSLMSLEIQIDYTYDTNNFFNTDEKRAAIEAVADFYGDMISETLLRIDPADFTSASWTPSITHPSTGASIDLTELSVVPENVIIVYVGSRELGGSTAGQAGPGGFSASGISSAWFERIRGRGSAGAAVSDPAARTDFSLWGGSIAFDIESTTPDTERSWNFSQSSNASGTEFISVALHEMGHVLGLGTAHSWNNLISAGTFTGSAAAQSFGTAPAADAFHFQGSLNSELFGSFGVMHGNSRPVLMLPSFTDTGSNFDVITDLDLAAMVDIGWELAPNTQFSASQLSPGAVTLNWNTVSFKNYTLNRGSAPNALSAVNISGAGDGASRSWSDPSPLSDKGFYNLSVTDRVASPGVRESTELEPSSADGEYRTITVEPIEVACEAH
ncbi:MAG: matrixin family metalloprotease [Verrucomicrobiota bacterium]